MNERTYLRFGATAEIELPFRDDSRLVVFAEPTAASCVEPALSVASCLRSPLDHPPLGMSVIPDDQVVVAIGQPIPRLGEVLDVVIRTLMDNGVSPQTICILLGPESVRNSQWQRIKQVLPAGIQWERHQPGDRAKVAYLAATRAGHPVYINRRLCDADLVVIVSCIHQPGSPGNLGIWGSVYPTFADWDTARSFFRRGGRRGQAQRVRECAEVGWLLGARFVLQVIPGAANQILHVLCGDIDTVAQAGAKLARNAWSFRVPRRADLVVTAIEGGPAQQTWHNLFRSLEAAGEVVDPGGAILACTELDQRLDRGAMAELLRHDPYVADDQQFPELEAVQPATLIPSLENVRIYLHSHLANELVEDLGMIPVAKASEIERICRRSQRPIVLSGGQHVWPVLASRASLVS